MSSPLEWEGAHSENLGQIYRAAHRRKSIRFSPALLHAFVVDDPNNYLVNWQI